MREGTKDGLVSVGLGARDTLRLEMGYLLYGNDVDERHTPLEAGISWAVKLDKGNFFGRERLVHQRQEGLKRKLRGIKMTGRGIPRSHYEIHFHGKKIGEITSGTFSPTLKQGIGLGYLEAGVVDAISVDVVIREKETPAVVVKPPFVAGSIKR